MKLLAASPVAGRSQDRPIEDRLDALGRLLDLAPGRVEPALADDAARIAAKAGERLRLGAHHTVVALAGSTGSGKSSLFNALVGEALSQVGMIRPTTAHAHAAVWGRRDAGDLLDWLDVPQRHVLPGDDAALDGLVLLDLPDVDSVHRGHRLEAERLVERVDLLLWVLDPQKYADGAVHDRYLAPLAGHRDVMLVILNQVDRLGPQAREECLADLDRLLRSEGLDGVPVVAASARTGEGLERLRAELTQRVSAKRASVQRLEADLSTLADTLARSWGPPGAGQAVGQAERERLVRALCDAVGVDLVVEATARSYRLRAHRATGWPVTRWTSRLRRDPARRLHLPQSPSSLVRTSLPAPSSIQRARVDTALRELGALASAGLAEPWPTLVRQAATRSRAQLPDLLDRAVATTDLGVGARPRWWRPAGALQLLLAVTALIGLTWLVVLFGIDWLQLPPPPLPHWGALPVPTVLLAGGLALGLLLALAAGLGARAGARRQARRARRRLEGAVERVAQDAVVGPVEQELAARADLHAAIEGLCP